MELVAESDVNVPSPTPAWGKTLCGQKISGNKDIEEVEGGKAGVSFLDINFRRNLSLGS